MADKNPVVARGAEAALKLQTGSVTRDALLDPQPQDVIPGDEDKGYHVGEVRQPAELVVHADGAAEFESIGDRPSKFTSSYADQVAAVDKLTSKREGRQHVPITAEAAKPAEKPAKAPKE